MDRPQLQRWFRGTLFVAAALYMQVGSFSRMILHIPTGPDLQSWRMYHGRGHDRCKLFAYEHRGDEVTQVDWAGRLDYELGNRARKVDDEAEANRIAVRLCRATADTDVGFSTALQCARRRRWKPVTVPAEPFCFGRGE